MKLFRTIILTAIMMIPLLMAGCVGSNLFPGKESKQKETPIVFTTTMPKTISDERILAIDSSLQAAVLNNQEEVLAFMLYDVLIDHIVYSEDGTLALVWLALVDKETDEIMPAEAGLALARLQQNDSVETSEWDVIIQSDEGWNQALNEVPDDLLDEETRSRYIYKIQSEPHAAKVYTGYRLPWPATLAKRLTGSIGHVFIYKTCPATCLYAFDFADGTMFPVVAARAGTVKYAVWQYANGNTTHTNYLILEDTTTVPTTYQIYYHLAQNSIPVEFRTPGTRVYQGQFIGNADDTGASTAHHLHFHVHADPVGYWGKSVDIVFDEVSVNGGRPRTCYESKAFPDYGSQCVSGDLYVSKNGDSEPPTGNITFPDADYVVTTPTLTVKGYGEDDRSVKYIQIMYTYDGTWHKIGDLIKTTPFSSKIDLCAAGIPDGPFFLSLQIMDGAGKVSEGLPGMRKLIKSYTCPGPPPACPPGDKQVSLYSDVDFQGNCKALEIGEYSSAEPFKAIGDNNVESIQVGKSAVARLYEQTEFQGTEDILLNSEYNLEGSPVGANALSSIKVEKRPKVPSEAVLRAPSSTTGDAPSSKDKITLSWDAVEAAVEYRSVLSGPDGQHLVLEWQPATMWVVGVLPEGTYNWSVWARNIAGESESSLEFIVEKPKLVSGSELMTGISYPLSTAVELKWLVNKGGEEIDHFEIQVRENEGDWQDWKTNVQTDASSTWFLGEAGSSYDFRLRSVDIYGNPEPYPDYVELSFTAIDTCEWDEYEGDGNEDNRWTGSTPLDLDERQEHNFCPAGDEDWVTFLAKGGQSYRISTAPVSGGAAARFSVYGFDGYNLLEEAVPEELNQNVTLEWTAPEDSVYYLKLEPIDPRLMGSDVRYNVSVERMTPVNPLSVLCAAIVLPFFWIILRIYHKLREKEMGENV